MLYLLLFTGVGHATVRDGITCLLASQDPDGSWAGNNNETELRDTIEVVETLQLLGQVGPSLAAGIGRVEDSFAANSDYLSRQVSVLAIAGSDASALQENVVAAQATETSNPADPNYPDGGWGLAPGFETDTLTTALAVSALRNGGFSSGLAVVGAVVVIGTPNMHQFIFPVTGSRLSILIREVTGSVRLLIQTPMSGTFFIDLTNVSSPLNLTGLPEEGGTYVLTVQTLSGSPNTYSLEARLFDGAFDVARVSRALSYLGFAQNADGSWGIRRGEDGLLTISTEVLQTLEGYGNAFGPRTVIDRGLDWVQTRQNPDGGFGSDPGVSTVYDTALAVLALHGGGRNAPAVIGSARAYLLATQGADGCWSGDAYQTALALRALVPTALGDVSCEGSRDSIDGLFVLQHDVGLRPVSNLCPPPAGNLYLPQCDVNDDGQCDSIDALFILQCDVGIPNVLCP